MSLTIGQLAKSLDIGTETIRYYEREGLIAQPEKPAQGYRRYSDSIKARLHFIRKAQGLGFSLAQIKHLLSLDNAPCNEVRQLATEKLDEVQSRIDNLQQLAEALQALISQCNSNKGEQCPIIEIFSDT
ncbi:MerR family DNA-binding protein [Simiduia aestuariiviva]|uniref:MerR family mercuric resistance operon transcriptional regulator n=1 Tax=Simiduia aestuariiviva TaxID=1510459 RepID=A0A839UHX1_9GAMM|nr:MerR family DNA-binding protein [Simiduia aestuariiviva]MBB3167452.1 MerR family mercuric resistance operon transcriptional regulator [Simiduia aestuariiviva]